MIFAAFYLACFISYIYGNWTGYNQGWNEYAHSDNKKRSLKEETELP